MIYSIRDIFSIHTEIIEEKDNNMNEFLDKLHDVLVKFEKGRFKTPDKRIFKAVLIKREDVYIEKKSIVQLKDHQKTCTATSRIKVILKYTFHEFI